MKRTLVLGTSTALMTTLAACTFPRTPNRPEAVYGPPQWSDSGNQEDPQSDDDEPFFDEPIDDVYGPPVLFDDDDDDKEPTDDYGYATKGFNNDARIPDVYGPPTSFDSSGAPGYATGIVRLVMRLLGMR
jgi:hypothetical protein